MGAWGRERVCSPSTRDGLGMLLRDRVRWDGFPAGDEAHESTGVVDGRPVVESGCCISCEPREDGRWRAQAHFRRGESLQNNHGTAAVRTGP